MTEAREGETRCGFVALLGAPNTGKSTLLNRYVGTKVSIVTPKVQTTRMRVSGISLHGPCQIVFVDTPGIFAPKGRFDRAMVAAAWQGATDADAVVVLVDAERGFEADTRRIVEGLEEHGRKAVLALNKIDLVKRESLLALAEELHATGVFSEVFMISARTGDGTGDLLDRLAAAMPEGPWLYPEDQVADIPMRLLAAEVTREQLFLQLHQELPYSIAVETEGWDERKDGSVRIAQVIYVRRDSQKGIVLGRGGQRIKSVGSKARRELEDVLGRRVHLSLYVKLRADWPEDPGIYRELGLDWKA